MEKCMRCGHDLIIGGNFMLSEVCGEELNEDDDAMVTNAHCPYCGARYELTDTPESEKKYYPYWNDKEIYLSDVPSALLLPWDGKPETYNSIFERNEGLPKEYFKSTFIDYDPDEVFIRENECPEKTSVEVKPMDEAIESVCKEVQNKGYYLNRALFNIDAKKSIIKIPIVRCELPKEVDDILKKEFSAHGYFASAIKNRCFKGYDMIVYQFEPIK